MKKIMLSICIAFFFCHALNAQLPSFKWQQLAGGNSNSPGRFNVIKLTPDGGFIAAGTMTGEFSAGDSSYIKGCHYSPFVTPDAWVVKFSSSGQIQWGHCYGGAGDDEAMGICSSSDGGYVITGFTQSTDGDLAGVNSDNNAAWVFKIDGTGNLQWSKNLFSANTGSGGTNVGNCVIATSDNGFMVSGSAFNTPNSHGSVDAMLWKLNVGGDTVWTKAYGGTGIDYGSHVIQMNDGGYTLTASAASNNGDLTGDNNTSTDNHFWLVRTNATGTIIWQKVPDPTLITQEILNNFTRCADGSYALIGSDQPDAGGVLGFQSIFVMHTDSIGGLLWEKNYGNYKSRSGSSGVGWGIVQSKEGSFIIDGQTLQTDSSFLNQCYGGFLMKIDFANGSFDGYQGYPNVPYNVTSNHDNNSFLYGIAEDALGNIALCGEYASGTSPYLDSIITARTWQLSGYVVALNSLGNLPVNLISFKAILINNETQLQWTTAQEINSSYFEVERSADGINFTSLTRVSGHKNSSIENTYEAIDASPLSGNNYYRLKEVDNVGISTYSAIVYVDINTGAKLSVKVFPNPAKNNFELIINTEKEQAANIGLYDMQGKILQSKSVQLSKDANTILFTINTLPNGNYFIRSNDIKIEEKVIKQ